MLKTSILILTHNAPRYVKKTLTTLNTITAAADRASCEVIVFDNASGAPTRKILNKLKDRGYIDKLHFSPENTFFARGNNLAAGLADPGSRYLLLLNSDVGIRRPEWLAQLIAWKEAGGFAAAAYGVTQGADPRADGYCLLIDRGIFERYQLNERYHWWGGVTALEAEILRDGHSILGIDNHDDIIYHYGGKSGDGFKKGGNQDTQYEEYMTAFRNAGSSVTILRLSAKTGVFRWLRRKIKKFI